MVGAGDGEDVTVLKRVGLRDAVHASEGRELIAGAVDDGIRCRSRRVLGSAGPGVDAAAGAVYGLRVRAGDFRWLVDAADTAGARWTSIGCCAPAAAVQNLAREEPQQPLSIG